MTTKRKPASPLEWLGGDNKPDALGYVAIDPTRWAAMASVMDKAEEEWSAEDRAAAQRQGWDIFEYDGTGLLEICRIDNPQECDHLTYTRPKFKSDETALAFVRKRAAKGDKRMQRAYRIHCRYWKQLRAEWKRRSEED
jgi:hypothetical protein